VLVNKRPILSEQQVSAEAACYVVLGALIGLRREDLARWSGLNHYSWAAV